MTVTYTQVGSTHNDYENGIVGLETVEVGLPNVGGVFESAVWELVRQRNDRPVTYSEQVLMTTEDCWSGYSEYTITSTWTEIVLTVPSHDWEERFESMAVFFATLGAVSEVKP